MRAKPKKISTELSGAVDSHRNLTKKAKKLKAPKNKFYCKVYVEIPGGWKEFCTLLGESKTNLKNNNINFSSNHPDRIFKFGDVKPIRIK